MAVARKPARMESERTAVRMQVWYADGTSSSVINPNKPALLLVFEQEFGKDTPETYREMYWLAWHALGRPEGTLDAWIETVEDLDRFEMPLGKAFR